MSDDRPRRAERGFTMLELLVAATVMLVAMMAAGTMLVQHSRLNRSQQTIAALQTDARASMALIVARLRTAGWDPIAAGIPAVQLDTNPGDGIDEIEVFADLDADGDTDGPDEQVLIRHIGNRVEWRRSAAGPFEIIAVGISNDADGDGTVEPMFVPDSTTDPTRIEIRITAAAPAPNPGGGASSRVTLAGEVALRRQL